MESRRVSIGWSVPIAAGLALVVLARAGAAPTTLAAGQAKVDALGTWWFQWLVEHAMFQGGALLHTDLIFFPWGKEILRDTGANVLDAALVAPIRVAFGGVAAWNALYVLILVTNGIAGGAVGRRAGALGLAAGTTLAVLHPTVLHELEMGRPTQAIVAPLLGALVAGERAVVEGGRRWIVVAGLLLALAGWFYWFAGLFGGLALLVLGFGRWRRLAGLYAIAAVATAPVVLPLLLDVQSGTTPGLLPVSRWWTALDLGTAEGDHMHINVLGVWGMATFVGERDSVPEGLVLGAGAVLAALAAPGRWRVVAVVSGVLALGPRPFDLPNPLYIGLASVLPPLWRLYWPARFLVLAVVAAAVGARSRVGQAGVALLVIEALVRGPLVLSAWSPVTPTLIAALAAEDGAVLSLPYGLDQWALVHQTAHGRPLLNGMHERFHFLVPPEQEALRTNNSFVSALIRLPMDPRAVVSPTPEDRTAFVGLGYRWVVLRRDVLLEPRAPAPRSREREVLRALIRVLGRPTEETEEAALWDLRVTPLLPPTR